MSAERIALGSDHNQCTTIGWNTPNVVACISPDGRKVGGRAAGWLGSAAAAAVAAVWSTTTLLLGPRLAARLTGHLAGLFPLVQYYKRGSTNSSIPPPYWLHAARLGQSAAQQVRAARCAVYQCGSSGCPASCISHPDAKRYMHPHAPPLPCRPALPSLPAAGI